MLNMMAAKGKKYQPTDLFTFEDEEQKAGKRKIAIDSPEAEEVFKRMEEKYKQRWQSR